MTAECRPPEGTPDGTVCVLRAPIDLLSLPPKPTFIKRVWKNETGWHLRDGGHHLSPVYGYIVGYRFHSIAEPPADG